MGNRKYMLNTIFSYHGSIKLTMNGTVKVLTVAGLGSRILLISLFALGEKNEGHVKSALNI